MIMELSRLFLSFLLREQGGVLRQKPRKPQLDPDPLTAYSIPGTDDILLEVDGVGLLVAPPSVASAFRAKPPQEEQNIRVYAATRELVSEGLRRVIEGAQQRGEQRSERQ
ncbi:MAG: hypothetical protein ABWK01_07900 [Infirmifilum sp.]